MGDRRGEVGGKRGGQGGDRRERENGAQTVERDGVVAERGPKDRGTKTEDKVGDRQGKERGERDCGGGGGGGAER